jgi:lysophospholipase L1-like esterase
VRLPKLKKVIIFAGQTLLIFLITFVLAEITFRMYKQFNPTFIFYDRSYNRFRGKPGASDYGFQLNSKGFKDLEFKSQKEPNTYRIVALGDSFAFGVVPYQYNYLTLLEQHLNSNGLRTEVINMGIPGIDPRDYLALLLNEGLQLQPDMVLVSFYVGNDFGDPIRVRRFKLHEYSDVVAFIKYVIDLNRKYQGKLIHDRPNYDDTISNFTDEAYLQIVKRSIWMYMKRARLNREFANGLGYLVRIKEVCDWNKMALKVVIIPDELQVNPALQAKVLKALKVSSDAVDFTLPNRFLQEQLQAYHIQYLDLFDEFSSASLQMSLYRPNDAHWNIAGNKLAADLLARYLSEHVNR